MPIAHTIMQTRSPRWVIKAYCHLEWIADTRLGYVLGLNYPHVTGCLLCPALLSPRAESRVASRTSAGIH